MNMESQIDDIWHELKELKFEIKELRNIIQDKEKE